MRELGEVKDALDMEVKQNFIDPLQNLHEKDLKEIQVRVQSFDAQTDRETNGQQIYIIDLLFKSRIQMYLLFINFLFAASPEENGGSPPGL